MVGTRGVQPERWDGRRGDACATNRRWSTAKHNFLLGNQTLKLEPHFLCGGSRVPVAIRNLNGDSHFLVVMPTTEYDRSCGGRWLAGDQKALRTLKSSYPSYNRSLYLIQKSQIKLNRLSGMYSRLTKRKDAMKREPKNVCSIFMECDIIPDANSQH